jgi:hypothetical protein
MKLNIPASPAYGVYISLIRFYKTPTVLLIYTVKSGKSLGNVRGKKIFT